MYLFSKLCMKSTQILYKLHIQCHIWHKLYLLNHYKTHQDINQDSYYSQNKNKTLPNKMKSLHIFYHYPHNINIKDCKVDKYSVY